MADASNDKPPLWADPHLSKALSQIAAAGETQQAEFKVTFPSHVGDLGKEIAAFATSNDGTIYLGVADDGEIVGIANGSDQDVRAKLRQRIEGLCSGPVQPTVTPSIRFAVHAGLTVMAIDVRKGSAPIYYAANVPYLRQLTAARPMSPQEVIDTVIEWHRGRGGGSDPKGEFLNGLATLIVNIEVHLAENQIRRLKPFSDENRFMLKSLADRARDAAINTPAELAEIRPELESIAEALDVVAHERPLLNRDRSDVLAASDEAANRAAALRKRWLPNSSFSKESIKNIRDEVSTQADRLGQLALRAQSLIVQNRLDDLRSAASQIGLILLTAATFGIGLGDVQAVQSLIEVGRRLRDLETRTIYMDGGRSMQRIVEDLEWASATLNAWVAQHLR